MAIAINEPKMGLEQDDGQHFQPNHLLVRTAVAPFQTTAKFQF